MDLKDKHVLVIGSERPWIEAMALQTGATKVTTLGMHIALFTITYSSLIGLYRAELSSLDFEPSLSSIQTASIVYISLSRARYASIICRIPT